MSEIRIPRFLSRELEVTQAKFEAIWNAFAGPMAQLSAENFHPAAGIPNALKREPLSLMRLTGAAGTTGIFVPEELDGATMVAWALRINGIRTVVDGDFDKVWAGGSATLYEAIPGGASSNLDTLPDGTGLALGVQLTRNLTHTLIGGSLLGVMTSALYPPLAGFNDADFMSLDVWLRAPHVE